MQTSLGHLELHVAPANLPFYRDLFDFLGWKTIYANDEMLGTGDANESSLWFVAHVKAGVTNDYDGPGVNHVAIQAESVADVDSTVTYLQGSGVPALFETPRHRPDAEFFHRKHAEQRLRLLPEEPGGETHYLLMGARFSSS